MRNILFKNLVFLLIDMKKKGWCIDSFPFTYNGVKTVVILRLYQENETLPSKYAKVALEFIDVHDVGNSIHAYADFYEVHFRTYVEFRDFFNLSELKTGKTRDILLAFAKNIAKYIPKKKIVEKKDPLERRLLGGRADGNDPNAVYLIDIRRDGSKSDGSLKKRTIKNSNKAETLNKRLYELYGSDKNLSFFYSNKEDDEKSDEEIIQMVAKRHY